jgi:hypothetical protein
LEENKMSKTAPANTVSANKGKSPIITIIVLAVLIAGILAGHFLGWYSLPFLTNSVNAISVLTVEGKVDIARASDTLSARAGMRLQNRDTVQTGCGSAAWLSLDAAKAVELAELTELRIGQGSRGFNLTLIEGEIRTEIKQALAEDEDFTVQVGDLALAVRGTLFTVRYDGGIIWVAVERGQVAVLDKNGNELALLGAGESGEYEAGEGETPTPEDGQGQGPDESEQTGNNSTLSDRPDFPADGYGVWDNGNYRYEGEWRNGKPNGYGVYTFSRSDDGRTYDERLEAEWVDGLPNGEAKLSEHGSEDTTEGPTDWEYTYSGTMVNGYFHGRMVEDYWHTFADGGGFDGTAVFEADMGTITAVISNTNPSYLAGSIGDDYYIGKVAGNFVANGHSFPWN